MAQSPKTVMGGASLSSKVWPPFMKTVQPIQSQPPAWHWRWKRSVSHPCPLLDCRKRWQSDHTSHHPHRFNELATESEKQNGSPDWNVDIHLQTLLWVYCPGHAGVKGNDWADRLAGKATLTSGLLLRRSKVLGSLRPYLWAQSQGHHIIDYLEERGMERGSAWQFSMKLKIWERNIVNQMNIGTIWKATLGKLLKHYGLFWACRYHLELNWDEWNWCFLCCLFQTWTEPSTQSQVHFHGQFYAGGDGLPEVTWKWCEANTCIVKMFCHS